MAISETKKLKKNTITSLILQITTIISGLILPRLILRAYGSDVNGLVNSVNQFLSMISFLELGVGSVVQSSLYKPLADRDSLQINRIVSSAGKFFRKLAYILVAYIIVLVLVYPFLVNQDFEALYSVTLILIMGMSSFAQYFFGLVDGIFLMADQRGYIYYSIQIVTLILNTFLCIFMIEVGGSIHTVKLMTSCVFLMRPIIIRKYVNRKYHINRSEYYSVEPIQQKWNGVAQHIASIILDSTDTVLLTVFSDIKYVSVYSVYNMIVMGVRQLIIAACTSVSSFWGRLLAINEMEELKESFAWTEWLTHTVTVLLFGCTMVLIVPFVMVYTNGIHDINYRQPVFAMLLTLAGAFRCIRLPYNCMIISGGHYKQTQRNYVIAAIMNIVISVLLVIKYGLVGVAAGTLVALFYQTIWMAGYISKNLIYWPVKNFIKQCFVDLLSVILCSMATTWIPLVSFTYISWVILAIEVFMIWIVIVFLVNYLIYRKWIKKIMMFKSNFFVR